jgi:hypothetical protein
MYPAPGYVVTAPAETCDHSPGRSLLIMHDGLEVDGYLIEFSGYINGQDYECDAAAVENVNIWSCISMLENRSAHNRAVSPEDKLPKIDLWVELDKSKLFPWESNVLGIALHKAYEYHKTNTAGYLAEFTLNTAVGAQREELRENILAVLGGTGFKLALLEPSNERPLFEEDGSHQWTCMLSSIPKETSFKDLFMLRDTISQAVFLPHSLITTPYLAFRMIQLGQAQALVGYQESEWLECKSSAYELRNIHESLWKHELAEDVAQFANSEAGGLLVVGYRTDKRSGVDTISKITPVPLSKTRLQVYRDVLRQRIHPPVSRVLITSFPWSKGEIVCVFVPPQKSENQPYLVSGSVVHGRYVRSGITIVRRQGDASIPVTAEEIHSTIVVGRAFLRGKFEQQPPS